MSNTKRSKDYGEFGGVVRSFLWLERDVGEIPGVVVAVGGNFDGMTVP